MIEQKVSKVDLGLLCNKINQKLLIYVYIVRRACRLPVVEAAQNNLCPNSVLIFHVSDFAGGNTMCENLSCN